MKKDGRMMSKQDLYEALLSKIFELGREPSFIEVREDENMPDPNDYAYYFGSFSAALKEAMEEYNFRKRAPGKKHCPISIKKPVSLPHNLRDKL